MGAILIPKTKTLESIRHKTVEDIPKRNDTMESLGAFGTLEKRDCMGRFHVGFEFFYVLTFRRSLIVLSDDVGIVRSDKTSQMIRVGGGTGSCRTVSMVFLVALLTS